MAVFCKYAERKGFAVVIVSLLRINSLSMESAWFDSHKLQFDVRDRGYGGFVIMSLRSLRG